MTTSQTVVFAVGLKNIVEEKDVIICIINLRNMSGAVLTCCCKHIQNREKMKFQPHYFVTFNKSLYRLYFQSLEADSSYHHFYGLTFFPIFQKYTAVPMFNFTCAFL